MTPTAYTMKSVPYIVTPRDTYSDLTGYSDGKFLSSLELYENVRYNSCKVDQGILVFNHCKCIVFVDDEKLLNRMFTIVEKASSWETSVVRFNIDHVGVAEIKY